MLIFRQGLDWYVSHLLAYVHAGVVDYFAGVAITTIVIAIIDILCASLHDPSCEMTKCALIIANNWEWIYSFAVYNSVELE